MNTCFLKEASMNKTTRALSVCTLAVCVTGSGFMARALAKGRSEIPAKISGCVVAGEAKGSFLLTGVTVDGNVPSNAFYRLDSTKGLRPHVGQRVEVSGVADLGEYEKGKVKVNTDDGKTTTKVTAGDQRLKVDSNVWAGSMGAAKMKADIDTYGFEVKRVKRIDGNCMK
jgi:hypothetical protein